MEQRPMYQRIFTVMAAAASLFIAHPALAWGDQGHELIADIAYGMLTPHARASVDALLANDTDPLTAPDFASRATWADKYRDEDNRKLHYDATKQWHFMDIEISAPDIETACFNFPVLAPGHLASAGTPDDCVADKIAQFEPELADPNTAATERLLALKFLMHFVGDIHQPLHSSDDHDAGGNCEQIRLTSQGQKSALHHFWDTDVVEALLSSDRATYPGDTLSSFADRIRQGLAPDQIAAWQADTDPKTWAQQSFVVAKTTAYNLPPHAACVPSQKPADYPAFVLSADYQAAAAHAALTQIEAAGVRLAMVINRSFP
jgi:hypothetical protein